MEMQIGSIVPMNVILRIGLEAVRMSEDIFNKEETYQLWISMVDHVVVHSKEDIRVVYRDGIEKNTGFLSNNIDV